jgi:hypothetical protein
MYGGVFMSDKFIKNAEFNFINKQVALIKDSYKKNAAPKVIQAVKDLAYAKIMELFPNTTTEQREMLDLSKLKTGQEFDRYIQNLVPFPQFSVSQLNKMFPKNKIKIT